MLTSSLEQRLLPLFAGRILPFDDPASRAYATLRSRARPAGQAIAPADGFIAAIAETHGFAVATRDTSYFIAAGLAVINPWHGRHTNSRQVGSALKPVCCSKPCKTMSFRRLVVVEHSAIPSASWCRTLTSGSYRQSCHTLVGAGATTQVLHVATVKTDR
jgi:hypothetical protein